MKVIGFHIFGENAGEITQGVAIAIKFEFQIFISKSLIIFPFS